MSIGSTTRRPVIETGPDGAKQEFQEECDINFIMRKYRTSGMVTHIAQNRGRFADVSEVGSYRESIDRVRETSVFFRGLPASVRAQFDNEPAFFLDWIADPANLAEIEELGLSPVLAPEEPEIVPVPDPIVPPPAVVEDP